MDKNQNNQNQNDVHIEQINPREELNDLEKTAILQFKLDEAQEKEVREGLKNLKETYNITAIEFLDEI